jgi:CheY-like chemotaxis protein
MSTTEGSKVVLVVEDDEATRDAFTLLLGCEGYRVRTASNGLLALEQLRAGDRPCLILLDLMMPVMDGFQLCARLKEDGALGSIPVIVCSAIGEARSRAGLLGAADYLDKPIDPDALLSVVRRHCLSV